MEFTLPTTKEEMYATLAEIFNFYRVRKEGYQEVVLQELVLERLNSTLLTDQELMEKAEKLLEAEHEREIKNYQTELSSKLIALQEKKDLIIKSGEEEIEKVILLYDESMAKVQNQALKAGLVNTSVSIDKTALLEDSKNQQIAQITQQNNQNLANINAEIEEINTKILQSAEYFSAIHQKDIQKKFIELCDEREKKQIEAFKYNNSLSEKEQRYSNSIKETSSSLYLRFLDIRAGEYTKDQLIEMGYFKDVISCVRAYFDTLEPLTAYQTFLAEDNLITYLDFYYEQVALGYKFRAGV